MSCSGAGLVVGARALRLLCLLPRVFVCLMVADNAACAGTENTVVTGDVSGNPAHGRTLETTSSLCRRDTPARCQQDRKCHGEQSGFHGIFLRMRC